MGLYDVYNGSMAVVAGTVSGTTSLTSPIAGEIHGVSMGMGTSDAGTVYLRLVDSLGGTMLSGTQTVSGTSFFGSSVPVNTSMSFRVESEGTQTGTASLFFRVHYQR